LRASRTLGFRTVAKNLHPTYAQMWLRPQNPYLSCLPNLGRALCSTSSSTVPSSRMHILDCNLKLTARTTAIRDHSRTRVLLSCCEGSEALSIPDTGHNYELTGSFSSVSPGGSGINAWTRLPCVQKDSYVLRTGTGRWCRRFAFDRKRIRFACPPLCLHW
jgi:hypothetical protein